MKRQLFLIGLLIITLAFCGYLALSQPSSISDAERQEYLAEADKYELLAIQTQRQADGDWQACRDLDPWRGRLYYDTYKDSAEHYDALAKEYRDQANYYRNLAHK